MVKGLPPTSFVFDDKTQVHPHQCGLLPGRYHLPNGPSVSAGLRDGCYELTPCLQHLRAQATLTSMSLKF